MVLGTNLALSSCTFSKMTPEEASQKGYVRIPSSASSLRGKDYRDVYTLFKVSKFTNIKIKMLGNLITGWVTKKDTVDHVSVGGDDDFGTKFVMPDTPVVIYVNSFEGATPDID